MSEDCQMTGSATPITTLFLDLGGVLLTNGWGRTVRRQAADLFKLDYAEMDERHHLSFNSYEDGKLTLDQYLDQVVFYQPRNFSRDEFKAFMYAQSQPYPEMLRLMRALKDCYHLKIAAVSNEGRELTTYRIEKFGLRDFIDSFVVSSYVHYRKPDRDIYALALDLTQATPEQVVYIDDRLLFIEVAGGMGFHTIRHKSTEETTAALASYGLSLP
jgi:putative hydrolase of the HAD superfamily